MRTKPIINRRLVQPPGRTRVRMEFTAVPAKDGRGIRFKVDRKITILKVLLQERFGEAGWTAYTDWLLLAAHQQSESIVDVRSGEVRDGNQSR